MIYSNTYGPISEATKKGVQLKVYFRQAFDSMRNVDWDTKTIDKCIRDIERCQDRIKGYKNGIKSGKVDLHVMLDKEYNKKLLKQSLGYGVIGGIIGGLIPQLMPAMLIAVSIGSSTMKKDKSGLLLPGIIVDLENENNKALEWLREERKRIISGKAEKKSLGKIISGKQESCIFSNIEII